MKFKCNNTEYEIKEVTCIEDEAETVGLTRYQERIIYLKRLEKDFMIKTLKHELTHVWLYEYAHNQEEKEFNCEDVCEIVASSNEFVNEVVEEYKKEVSSNKKWQENHKDDWLDALKYAIESINKNIQIKVN